MAGCKFRFCCIEIHFAYVQNLKKLKNSAFYNKLPYGGGESGGEIDDKDGSESGKGNNDGEDFDIPLTQRMSQYTADNLTELNMETLLKRFDNINPESI